MRYAEALASYRVLSVVAAVAAVVLCARVTPFRDRLSATLLGLGALGLSFPFVFGLGLGQPDAFVMLSLAVGIFRPDTTLMYCCTLW